MVIFFSLLEMYCDSVYISWINQIKLVYMINKNVNFECMAIAKHIINLYNDKLIVKCILMLVKNFYTPVVPIANTCIIG